jgi:hypothetical protein
MKQLTTYIKEGLFEKDNVDKLTKALNHHIELTISKINNIGVYGWQLFHVNKQERDLTKFIDKITLDGKEIDVKDCYENLGRCYEKINGEGIVKIYFNEDIYTGEEFHRLFSKTDIKEITFMPTIKNKKLNFAECFHKSLVEKVNFHDNFKSNKISSLDMAFDECHYLTEIINIDKLNLSECKNISFTFNNASNLSTETINNFFKNDFSNVEFAIKVIEGMNNRKNSGRTPYELDLTTFNFNNCFEYENKWIINKIPLPDGTKIKLTQDQYDFMLKHCRSFKITRKEIKEGKKYIFEIV